MRIVELRIDEPHMNIVTRSGVVTGNDKADGNKVVEDTWVRNNKKKALMFDLHKEKKYSWK